MPKSYAPRFQSPSGPQKRQQKNRLFRSVFLLPFANFTPKIGMENSYALRVRLSGIIYEPAITELILLRNKTKSAGNGKATPAFLLFHMYGKDTDFSNKPRRMK
jgi:hypothetical protein